MSVNKWAPASGSDTRNAHTAHCFDRCNHFFSSRVSLCFVMNGAMPPFNQFWKVIMSLCHCSTFQKWGKMSVSQSIDWAFLSYFLFWHYRFYLGYFSRKSKKVNLLHDSQKCISNYNIIIVVSLVRQWHHYQGYQWPSPEPSALIMRKCLLRAPIVADKVIISRHLSYIISHYVGSNGENRNVSACWLAHKQVCKWYLFYLLLGLLVGQVNEPINCVCLSSQRDITDIPAPGLGEVCGPCEGRLLFVKLDVCKIGWPLLESDIWSRIKYFVE